MDQPIRRNPSSRAAFAFGAALAAVLGLLALVRLFKTAAADSSDFAVFWQAAGAWWTGADPYRFAALARGFVFKYPPASLPLFLPLAWIPLSAGKLAWASLETLALLYSARCLVRAGLKPVVVAFTTAAFWYLLFEHFKYGQTMLPLLAASLWAMSAARRESRWVAAALEYLLLLKIFTAYALVGDARRMGAPRTLVRTALILVGAHAILGGIALINGHPPVAEIASMYRGWIYNATGSAAELGLDNVRGAVNHGFPALILRYVDPRARHPAWDAPVSFAIALALGAAWWRASAGLRREERWSGWLALAAVAHPLAWSHSFLLAYPLFAHALGAATGRVWQGRRARQGIVLAAWGAGITLTGLWVPQVVAGLAMPLELCGSKSWGVFLAAVALTYGGSVRERI